MIASCSASGHAHVPCDSGRAADPEVVLSGLACHELVEEQVDRFDASAAEAIAQFDPLVVAEAAKDRARRGNADAIASIAEIVRERSDKAKARPKFDHVEIARRATSSLRRGHERKALFKPALDAVEG
jgi:hypothetical protein